MGERRRRSARHRRTRTLMHAGGALLLGTLGSLELAHLFADVQRASTEEMLRKADEDGLADQRIRPENEDALVRALRFGTLITLEAGDLVVDLVGGGPLLTTGSQRVACPIVAVSSHGDAMWGAGSTMTALTRAVCASTANL